MKGFRAALKRAMAGWHEEWRPGLAGRAATCPTCGRRAPFRTGCHRQVAGQPHYAQADCPACGRTIAHTDLAAIALATPAGRRFWQEERRIARRAPEREIEAEGAPAVVVRWESLGGAARLEIVAARETFEIIRASRS